MASNASAAPKEFTPSLSRLQSTLFLLLDVIPYHTRQGELFHTVGICVERLGRRYTHSTDPSPNTNP